MTARMIASVLQLHGRCHQTVCSEVMFRVPILLAVEAYKCDCFSLPMTWSGHRIRTGCYQGLTLLIKAGADVEGVVGEEALVVEGVAQQLRAGCHAQGPPVIELVADVALLQHLVQRARIRLEPWRQDRQLVRPAQPSEGSARSVILSANSDSHL